MYHFKLAANILVMGKNNGEETNLARQTGFTVIAFTAALSTLGALKADCTNLTVTHTSNKTSKNIQHQQHSICFTFGHKELLMHGQL